MKSAASMFSPHGHGNGSRRMKSAQSERECRGGRSSPSGEEPSRSFAPRGRPRRGSTRYDGSGDVHRGGRSAASPPDGECERPEGAKALAYEILGRLEGDPELVVASGPLACRSSGR